MRWANGGETDESNISVKSRGANQQVLILGAGSGDCANVRAVPLSRQPIYVPRNAKLW
eukprot:CAMPEP_0175913370 /NCGR_PEP_ID=MMETSP0108-20121206/9231_1 /TAXON_ID=195067 ORGANISM="Goniomonas pacifica, Strain CCMP1869" /NCGR_SAMPLE_ID=MMETSP0108 /ASSEMBLY_ACC=CAM_ASM_000204 /LENGTH=57 /DNA_ID=CAMNT_0017235759 /DNA_START=332 /DNA_END=502 /DNA_ORIENTATION=+